MTVEETKIDATPNESETKKVVTDDVTKLSDKDIKWRARYKLAKEESETLKAKIDSEKAELNTKLVNTTKERQVYESKFIDAELKAHAISAGITDIELVQLIDKTNVKLDEQGNLQGVKEAIAEFKTKKPHFFGSEKKMNTSSGAKFPEDTKPVPVDARKMSKEDWNKNKSSYMAGYIPRS